MPEGYNLPHFSSMLSVLPQPVTPPRQAGQLQTSRKSLPAPNKSQRTRVQDSVGGDTWKCWPSCDRNLHNKPLPACPPPTMTEKQKHTGYTLFAVPPTPPVRKYYLTKREYVGDPEIASTSSDPNSNHLSWSSDDSLPPLPPHTPPELLPAPLKIRKYRFSGDSSSPDQISPCRRRGLSAHKRASIRNSIIYPPANLKRLSRNRSPTRAKRPESKVFRRQSRALILGHGQKRDIASSTSTNQWFDIEGGLVDRKKLSIYLGNVLGSTFEVPNLDHEPEHDLEPVTLDNVFGSRARPGPLNSNPPDSLPNPRPCTATKCECAPDRVLCQGKSSPEFKIFTRWPVFRKSQLSISSTACRLQVPRGQLDSTPPKHKSPTRIRSPTKQVTPPKSRTPQLREIALSSSPPGLVYDNPLHSDDLDWSLLRSSPQDTDVFRSDAHMTLPTTPFVKDAIASARTQRYSSAPVVKSQPPPSSYKPVKTKFLQPDSPGSDIAVESSVSSFEFDFDYDSTRHFQQAPSAERNRLSREVLHRHLRNTKTVLPDNDLIYLPSLDERPSEARVASIALGVPAKPTLVTHRTTSSPVSVPYDKSIDTLGVGTMQYCTRVQIKRPPSEINIPKRRKAPNDTRASHHGANRDTEKTWDLAYVRDRAQSRVTSDGSPVLGRGKLVLISPRETWLE